MKGVYNVDMNDTTPDYQDIALSSVIATKYASGATGSSTLNWAAQAVKRLQSWGFNTLGEYASAYTWPVFTDSRWGTPDSTIPVKMPYIVIIRPSWYSLFNQQGFASGPVKDLVNGIRTSVFPGYRSQSADFWDPRFAEWFQAALAKDVTIRAGYAGPNNDYLVGFDIDETDNIQGYGAGQDFPTVDIGITGRFEDHINPHIGWFVLVTAATQSSNPQFNVAYSDTKVYAKAEFVNWLSARYNGTISLLNNAWGSRYSTFGSSGGWGVGTGVLDEDGTCPSRATTCWIPSDAYGLTGAPAAMKTDLDDFLFHHMDKYFSMIKSTFQAQAPGFLLFGSSPVGSWGSPPRRQILQAAAPYLDAYTFGNIPTFMCSLCTDIQQRIDFAAQYGGDKPWLDWEGFLANADSYWSSYALSTDAIKTQEQRGLLYEQMVSQLLKAKDSSGTYHVAGFQWWDYYDMRREHANWGLLTRRDNAYDAVQARIAAGVDQWGYPTGGEQANYGDFLSSVIAAHAAVYSAGASPSSRATITITSSANPAAIGQPVTLTAKVSGSSGPATGTVQFFDGNAWLGAATLRSAAGSFTTSSLAGGAHSIGVAYSGNTNYVPSSSQPYNQVIGPPPKASASITVTSSANPATFGQPVTLTAKVSGSNGTPTGTVQFFDGSAGVGTATLNSGAGSFTTSSLAVGTHSIGVAYSGDSNYNPNSSQPYSQVIEPRPKTSVTITVTSSANPAAIGQPVTLTARVSGSNETPTGTVQFFDGSAWLGAATLSSGAGSFTTSSLAIGTHSIGVSYGGDSNYNPNASQPYSQVITAQTAGNGKGILVASPGGFRPMPLRFLATGHSGRNRGAAWAPLEGLVFNGGIRLRF